MNISTAQICDALVLKPTIRRDVEICVSTFPIFSAGHYIEGRIAIIEAGGTLLSRQAEIARLVDQEYVAVIENYGRMDCACFEMSDLTPFKKIAKGIIVNGCLRNSSRIADIGMSVRARSANPEPFFKASLENTQLHPPVRFPFHDQGYVIGDGDALIVMRSREVLVNLGLLT